MVTLLLTIEAFVNFVFLQKDLDLLPLKANWSFFPFPPDCQVALEARGFPANLNKRLGIEPGKYSEICSWYRKTFVLPSYHIHIFIWGNFVFKSLQLELARYNKYTKQNLLESSFGYKIPNRVFRIQRELKIGDKLAKFDIQDIPSLSE